MRKLRTVLVAVLALMTFMAMSATAFAYEVTLTPNQDDKGTHTYEAYQIFKGDLKETTEGTTTKKILSNIEWGTGVNGAALLTELKTTSFGEAKPFENCASAADVAEVLKGFDNDAANTQQFADIVGKHLAAPSGTYAEGKITGLDAGYYLIKDQDGTQDGKENAAYTRFILQVVSDVTADVKSEVPSVDKKIVDGENRLSANSASIGDKIPYEVTSKVPDMTGYDKYFFVLNDTMSKGLTFNNDVTIKIGETALGNDAFTVTTSEGQNGTTNIKIVLKNFIQYKNQKGAAITVNYSATLNENADLTSTGNVNEVKLTYSNNPNHNYTGENEPGPGEPTGETPESIVKTFTTGIELTKVDANDTTKTLTGAKFKITGDKVSVTLINKEIFETSAEGTWYMLKDGTYTQTAPTEDTMESYDSDQKYAKVTKVEQSTKTEPVVAEGYVDANGKLKFEGLAAGTYKIKEMVAPDGYNMLSGDITVVINGEMDQTEKTCTWSATVDGKDVTMSDNLVKFNVENKSGTELPSTGGMGTTIFYVLGGVLVLIASVTLVARRRVSASK